MLAFCRSRMLKAVRHPSKGLQMQLQGLLCTVWWHYLQQHLLSGMCIFFPDYLKLNVCVCVWWCLRYSQVQNLYFPSLSRFCFHYYGKVGRYLTEGHFSFVAPLEDWNLLWCQHDVGHNYVVQWLRHIHKVTNWMFSIYDSQKKPYIFINMLIIKSTILSIDMLDQIIKTWLPKNEHKRHLHKHTFSKVVSQFFLENPTKQDLLHQLHQILCCYIAII